MLGRFRLDSRKRAVVHWPQAAQKVMELLSLEVFKNCGDVALRDMVSEHGGEGLGMDLGISVVFSGLIDSLMQCVLLVALFFYISNGINDHSQRF